MHSLNISLKAYQCMLNCSSKSFHLHEYDILRSKMHVAVICEHLYAFRIGALFHPRILDILLKYFLKIESHQKIFTTQPVQVERPLLILRPLQTCNSTSSKVFLFFQETHTSIVVLPDRVGTIHGARNVLCLFCNGRSARHFWFISFCIRNTLSVTPLSGQKSLSY